MPKFILQVRTRDNLLELLEQNQTSAWKVGKERIQQITHVQIVNFQGTQMIEGVFDRNASFYLEPPDDNRLVVKFLDGRIINCNVQFAGQMPIRYIQENSPT
jgi:hypothetical protein